MRHRDMTREQPLASRFHGRQPRGRHPGSLPTLEINPFHEQPDDELLAAPDAELPVKALQVGMNGVGGYAQVARDGALSLVVENPPGDLGFAGGEPKGCADGLPLSLRRGERLRMWSGFAHGAGVAPGIEALLVRLARAAVNSRC